MANEEDQGFVIRDKRGQSRDAPSSPPNVSAHTPEGSTDAQPADAHPQKSMLPLSFSSFIFSLGTSALMLMGETLSPDEPKAQANLPQAKEIVDILSILEEKTKGNLTSEESVVIQDMLYTLRMKYVEAVAGKKSTT